MASGQKIYNFSKRGRKAHSSGGKVLNFRHIENTKLQKELSPFEGDSPINKLKTLILSVPRTGPGIIKAMQSFLEISDAVCKIIFATPVVTQSEQVENCCDYCRGICNWKTTNESNETVTFDQVLVTIFIKSLCKRFTYKERLEDLLKHRQIPLEKKDKWLNYQYETQGRLLKETDSRSILFLKKLFCTKPGFVYQVLESLLRLTDGEALLYDYINTMLDSIRARNVVCVQLTELKNKKEHFQSIRQLVQENERVPLRTRNLLTEHWNERFEIFNRRGGQRH